LIPPFGSTSCARFPRYLKKARATSDDVGELSTISFCVRKMPQIVD
jgi:hypothetical protein